MRAYSALRFNPVQCSTSFILRSRAASSCSATVLCWVFGVFISEQYRTFLDAYMFSVYMYTYFVRVLSKSAEISDIAYSSAQKAVGGSAQHPVPADKGTSVHPSTKSLEKADIAYSRSNLDASD